MFESLMKWFGTGTAEEVVREPTAVYGHAVVSRDTYHRTDIGDQTQDGVVVDGFKDEGRYVLVVRRYE